MSEHIEREANLLTKIILQGARIYDLEKEVEARTETASDQGRVHIEQHNQIVALNEQVIRLLGEKVKAENERDRLLAMLKRLLDCCDDDEEYAANQDASKLIAEIEGSK